MFLFAWMLHIAEAKTFLQGLALAYAYALVLFAWDTLLYSFAANNSVTPEEILQYYKILKNIKLGRRQMKTKEEVLQQIDYFREQLIITIEEKALINPDESGETDLIILSLIDKLETLLWVVDIELFEVFDNDYFVPNIS